MRHRLQANLEVRTARSRFWEGLSWPSQCPPPVVVGPLRQRPDVSIDQTTRGPHAATPTATGGSELSSLAPSLSTGGTGLQGGPAKVEQTPERSKMSKNPTDGIILVII